jgi:hypothetical protein
VDRDADLLMPDDSPPYLWRRQSQQKNFHKGSNQNTRSRFLAAARAARSKASRFVLLSPFFESIAMLDTWIFLVFAAMGCKSPVLHHGL